MSTDTDCNMPYHGPYQKKISLRVLGYSGYDLRVDDFGQICCWSYYRVGNAVNGRMLSPNNGRVQLSDDNGKKHKFFLYALWCTAVHGPPPSVENQRWSVHHIDLNHSNNNPNNIRWATARQQNINRNAYKRNMKWVPFTEADKLMVPKKFMHRWFIQTGFEVKQKNKDSVWLKAIDRSLSFDYVLCCISSRPYLMSRIITHVFGDRDDVVLKDICDESIIIEHIDNNKLNNCKDNLLVSNQSNNMNSWHASGKSTRKRVYAMSIVDNTDMRVFESAAEAAREIPNTHSTHIISVCKGRKRYKTAGGFLFSYNPFN